MNNKGSFKDEGSVGKKVKGFFKESGFYIAIVVGLCALAAGAVFFSTNQILTDPEPNQAKENGQNQDNNLGYLDYTNPIDEEPDQSAIVDDGTLNSDEGPYVGMTDGETSFDDNDVTAENPANPANPTPNAPNNEPKDKTSKDDSKSASANVEANLDDNSATEDVVLAVVRPAFQSPIAGSVQQEYSMDKLVFSPTFNEWRTHSGVDISAPRGEVVRAVGNGIISEIKNDPRYGFTIVIDHKNGYKSLYANLATDPAIQTGQEVKQGDPIGAVGATAIFESAEPTHLHFELYKEDKLVDPAAYIDIGK